MSAVVDLAIWIMRSLSPQSLGVTENFPLGPTQAQSACFPSNVNSLQHTHITLDSRQIRVVHSGLDPKIIKMTRHHQVSQFIVVHTLAREESCICGYIALAKTPHSIAQPSSSSAPLYNPKYRRDCHHNPLCSFKNILRWIGIAGDLRIACEIRKVKYLNTYFLPGTFIYYLSPTTCMTCSSNSQPSEACKRHAQHLRL
jgi:hypothetical protein